MARTVKVAVIGSGLAGLTAAYLLTRTRSSENEDDVAFDVHIFEKSSFLGMDSSSISVPIPNTNREWRIDVPMRSFQGGYYPQLIALYKHLGVEFHRRDFSYSFSLLSQSSKPQHRLITTTMIYNGASGLAGVSIPSMMNDIHVDSKHKGLAYRLISNTVTLVFFAIFTIQLAFNYVRLISLTLPFWRPEKIQTMTFRQWAEYSVPRGFLAQQMGWEVAWRDFTWNVLLPLFSAVCTTTEEDVLEHPVEEMLDYIWLTLGTHHYVVAKGSREVVSRLTCNVQHIHLRSWITDIHPDSRDSRLVSITCQTPTEVTVHTGFHHIIFATQANRAIPILQSYMSSLPSDAAQRPPVNAQIECLRAFQYHNTVVINHTDDSLMPDNLEDRRELNLINLERPLYGWAKQRHIGSEGFPLRCVSETHTMATHVLPVPAGYPEELPRMYQTTNPIIRPREESIVSVAVLERAVLTLKAKKMLEGLHQETGRRWWQCRVESGAKLGLLQGAGRMNVENGEWAAAKSDLPGIWICGSFAYGGIPLLEGCVVSARTVVEQGLLASEGVVVTKSPW